MNAGSPVNSPTIEQIEAEMNSLKEEIERAKSENAELGGRIKQTLEGIDKEFGAKTLEGAKKVQLGIEKQVENLQHGVVNKYTNLKETYQW